MALLGSYEGSSKGCNNVLPIRVLRQGCSEDAHKESLEHALCERLLRHHRHLRSFGEGGLDIGYWVLGL